MNFHINSFDHTHKQNFSKLYLESENRLFSKLKTLDLKNSHISEYNQRYLGEHIQDRKKISWFLSHIFMLVYAKNNYTFTNLCIIDYGGGSGMLSFMAKELGIAKVIYNDIYDVSCDDVLITSKLLNIDIDEIICGDINKVISVVETKAIEPHFILAHDVIEHIYNVEKWFKQIQASSTHKFSIICTSHANKYNPLISIKLRALQRAAETQNRHKVWGHKERDSLTNFITIRKNIISEYDNTLDENTIELLAKNTRGLIKQEILEVVNEFKTNNKVSYKISDPTNTCDPLTGNWIEQLIELYRLKNNIESEKMSVFISFGYYINEKGNSIVKLLKLLTNYIIKSTGSYGRFLSPYYILECTINK